MLNFEFHTPTKIYFGVGVHKDIGEIIASYGFKKILLHYGMGSIKKSGLYDDITNSLKKQSIEFAELGGVQPNPKVSLVRQGAAICKKEKPDMILAVGGGSVIDSAKVIAISALTDIDAWDFSAKRQTPTDALPIGVVLTISASGSEMSTSAVITDEQQKLKRGFNSQLNRPLFSVLNPELTYSVGRFQTGCGIVDIMMHTLERYFSKNKDNDLSDRISEALLKSVIKAGEVALNNPTDYQARATLMWAGSLSHNDLMGVGRDYFFSCHQMEHELSGMYDHVAHAAGLSVLFPAWAKYVYKHSPDIFCQYATRVWNIDMNFQEPLETALKGIITTENYFKAIGMPTRLNQLNITDEKFEEMANKCTYLGKRTLPSYIPLGEKEIIEILKLCE
ncbi:MAG: iron-containing alcohol dehydrogenase [Clostridiaceae bacterium]|nr:iron-containing alcohol dehydrogenase [Clostridiaceae bacterium]